MQIDSGRKAWCNLILENVAAHCFGMLWDTLRFWKNVMQLESGKFATNRSRFFVNRFLKLNFAFILPGDSEKHLTLFDLGKCCCKSMLEFFGYNTGKSEATPFGKNDGDFDVWQLKTQGNAAPFSQRALRWICFFRSQVGNRRKCWLFLGDFQFRSSKQGVMLPIFPTDILHAFGYSVCRSKQDVRFSPESSWMLFDVWQLKTQGNAAHFSPRALGSCLTLPVCGSKNEEMLPTFFTEALGWM